MALTRTDKRNISRLMTTAAVLTRYALEPHGHRVHHYELRDDDLGEAIVFEDGFEAEFEVNLDRSFIDMRIHRMQRPACFHPATGERLSAIERLPASEGPFAARFHFDGRKEVAFVDDTGLRAMTADEAAAWDARIVATYKRRLKPFALTAITA